MVIQLDRFLLSPVIFPFAKCQLSGPFQTFSLLGSFRRSGLTIMFILKWGNHLRSQSLRIFTIPCGVLQGHSARSFVNSCFRLPASTLIPCQLLFNTIVQGQQGGLADKDVWCPSLTTGVVSPDHEVKVEEGITNYSELFPALHVHSGMHTHTCTL